MTDTAEIDAKPRPRPGKGARSEQKGKAAVTLSEHVVEIVSDSGEGAQRCGQTFGAIASQMGNGVWTEEIIPAEIRPPARSVAGGSGNRIRIGAGRITNAGNETDLVIAFNEQELIGRAYRRTQARLHNLAGKHVAREQGPENRRVLCRDP